MAVNEGDCRDVVLFTEALQLPESRRADFLRQQCAGDEELCHKVEALLRAHERSGGFLETPVIGLPAESDRTTPIGEEPGDRIGRYKLLQQIGEGGYGVVFMAEQEEPVRRRVALKIIKPGMDTRSVVARFEAERQALALMDHPNIAKVFDAGSTESGRPYFVMELIRGIRITEYCDQNSLTTEERLKLFVQVCQAVQHAHQKGVIHRDIKPSNILVTAAETGAAVPVVIDFGIAKATTNQRLTDKTLFTAFEMLIGTPAYMSPEQAALTSVDLDTRTDIYSLGVLLYELLTGSTPFETRELLKAGLDEIRRVIREQEPAPPSTRLSKMRGADLTIVAQHRKSEPPNLIRAVSGDLDWIAMKAMEKDRTRRYETANGLALDVQRFLADEVISARPPSKSYRFQKILLRNKLLFSGIGVIAALLVLSLIVISASLARERHARRDADNDKQKAETEAAKSQQVTQFFKDMLQGVGPSAARGRNTEMLREILDRTAQRVGEQMTNQPVVEAELRRLIGGLYLEIGVYDEAEKMHHAALTLNRNSGAPESEVAGALYDLGMALWKQRKLRDAEIAHAEALGIRRRLFGNLHPDVAASLNNLGSVYRRQQKLTEAEALTREGLQIRRELFGGEHLEVADSLRNLSIILGDQGQRTESEATAREMLAMRRRLLGNEHPLVASALVDVAWAAGFTGKLDEAELMEGEALEIQRKLLGDEHPDVAKSIYSLGERLRQRGNLNGAQLVLSAALSIQRKLLTEEHPDFLATLRGLGWTLAEEGKWGEAEIAYREALVLWRKRAPNDDPQVLSGFESLIRALIAQKKFDEAEKLLGEALTPVVVQKASSAELLALRAELMSRQGRFKEAAVAADRALNHQPLNDDRYPLLAALLAKIQDRPRYEQLCRRILTTFPNPKNPYAADKLAKSCLLLPTSEVDLRIVGPMADIAVKPGAGDEWSTPFFQACKALSEYRQGHFQEAIEWGRKSLESPHTKAHGLACSVLAMAHWQLGEEEIARRMLARGESLAPPVLPEGEAGESGDAWMNWIIARVSLDEAKKLTDGGPAPRP